MNLQLISDALCLLGVVLFVEGEKPMSVEVVHDKDYFVRLRVAIDQIFYFLDPICCRSVLSHTDYVPSTERLNKPEDAASAIALIFRINFLVASQPHGEKFTHLTPTTDMPYHPSTPQDASDYRVSRIHQAYPPCKLRIPHLLFEGCTSSRFCVANFFLGYSCNRGLADRLLEDHLTCIRQHTYDPSSTSFRYGTAGDFQQFRVRASVQLLLAMV
jgi:hypothetical protein